MNTYKPFFMIYQFYVEDMKLHGVNRDVFSILFGKCCYSKNGIADCSLTEMSKLSGWSRQAIQTAVKYLEKHGLISRDHPAGKRTTYTLLKVIPDDSRKPCWAETATDPAGKGTVQGDGHQVSNSFNTTGKGNGQHCTSKLYGTVQPDGHNINIDKKRNYYNSKYYGKKSNRGSSIEIETPYGFEGETVL